MGERVVIIAFFYFIPLHFFASLFLSTSWGSRHHPPLSPPPAFPLGYKLNLINDLFCLACLALAMFSKWPNGNVSLVSACWQSGRLCWGQANRAGLGFKGGLGAK